MRAARLVSVVGAFMASLAVLSAWSLVVLRAAEAVGDTALAFPVSVFAIVGGIASVWFSFLWTYNKIEGALDERLLAEAARRRQQDD